MRSKGQQNLYNIQILSVLCVPKGRSGEGRLTLFVIKYKQQEQKRHLCTFCLR